MAQKVYCKVLDVRNYIWYSGAASFEVCNETVGILPQPRNREIRSSTLLVVNSITTFGFLSYGNPHCQS